MPSIWPVRIAASEVGKAPNATVLMPSAPKPSLIARRLASHSVSEPVVVTESVRPFRSFTVLIGLS